MSKESITHILTKQGKGNALIIVVGGAQESFDAKPGTAVLKLKDRKGFIRMAIKTGSEITHHLQLHFGRIIN